MQVRWDAIILVGLYRHVSPRMELDRQGSLLSERQYPPADQTSAHDPVTFILTAAGLLDTLIGWELAADVQTVDHRGLELMSIGINW